MRKIVRVDYLHLRREEQHTFNEKVLQIVLDTCGECGLPYQKMSEASAEFNRLLGEKVQNTKLSLMDLDSVADSAWYSLNMQIRASLVHPRASVREAASKVEEIFSQTPNPTNLNYDQEYGSLRTLLMQLSSLDASVLRAALVNEHVAALQAAVDAFCEASTEKVKALSLKQAGALKTAINNCFQAWTSLAKYLELMDQLNGLAGAGNAIELLNIMNRGIKQRLEQRSKSSSADDSVNNVVSAAESGEA